MVNAELLILRLLYLVEEFESLKTSLEDHLAYISKFEVHIYPLTQDLHILNLWESFVCVSKIGTKPINAGYLFGVHVEGQG